MRMRLPIIACLVLLALWPFPSAAGNATNAAPRSVVLMIADGMGPAHLTALKITRPQLHMGRLKTGGLVSTDAADALVGPVPDKAALQPFVAPDRVPVLL